MDGMDDTARTGNRGKNALVGDIREGGRERGSQWTSVRVNG